MRHYQSLLYVSHGTADETAGLKQALSLARENKAKLTVLLISPEFPKDFPEHQNTFQDALMQQAATSIAATKKAIKLPEEAVEISIQLVSNQTPAITIIQEVLRNNHDLVIKEAEPSKLKSGFKAVDLELLRKCPVPIWLCQPITQSRKEIKVAVAIDPISDEPAALALSKQLLMLSSSLASSCSGELDIISCWDYKLEAYLRDNVWIKTSDEEITQDVEEAKKEHRAALDNLIQSVQLDNTFHVHHLRGSAEEIIPTFTKEKQVDILVMGTVARTGIPGFMIGNTAENIVQNINCSLLALKPQGFVTPVKI